MTSTNQLQYLLKKQKTVNMIRILLLVDFLKQFLYGDFALPSIYSELFLAEEKSWHGVRGRKKYIERCVYIKGR